MAELLNFPRWQIVLSWDLILVKPHVRACGPVREPRNARRSGSWPVRPHSGPPLPRLRSTQVGRVTPRRLWWKKSERPGCLAQSTVAARYLTQTLVEPALVPVRTGPASFRIDKGIELLAAGDGRVAEVLSGRARMGRTEDVARQGPEPCRRRASSPRSGPGGPGSDSRRTRWDSGWRRRRRPCTGRPRTTARSSSCCLA